MSSAAVAAMTVTAFKARIRPKFNARTQISRIAQKERVLYFIIKATRTHSNASGRSNLLGWPIWQDLVSLSFLVRLNANSTVIYQSPREHITSKRCTSHEESGLVRSILLLQFC